jgi:multidrug efflux pump subunit AcrA (membrane-fusion protein)
VQLSIVAQKINEGLVVPTSAILNQADGSKAVMVVGSDNRAHLHVVQVGIHSSDGDQITSGLSTGQQVIVTGAFGLPDNTQVKVQPPPETETEKGRD